MEIKPIRLSVNAGLDAKDDSLASLRENFRRVSMAVGKAYHGNYYAKLPGTTVHEVPALLATIGDFLAVMSRLDAEYGPDGVLPLADAADAVDETLRAMADLESWLIRLELGEQLPHLQSVEIGAGYWAMRHELPISVAEPIVNALAAQSNAASTKQETAAVYAMMQGFLSHFSDAYEADLERSNPQRPWRLLNLNFAITAIRTGDAILIRYAFDKLNAHLPDECAGFYGEAHVIASQPGFPLATRGLIEAEIARWTRVH